MGPSGRIYVGSLSLEGWDFSNCKSEVIVLEAGKELPSRFGDQPTSRIFRGNPMIFVLSRNFAVTYAIFGYFWVNLPDF